MSQNTAATYQQPLLAPTTPRLVAPQRIDIEVKMVGQNQFLNSWERAGELVAKIEALLSREVKP